jgi:hypothetical protein
MNLIRIIALLKQIDPPPDLLDEETYRAWFIDLSETVTDIATILDDGVARRAAKTIAVIGTDNKLWKQFYEVLLDARERVG